MTPQREEIAYHRGAARAELLRLALMRLCLRRPEAAGLLVKTGRLWREE